MNAAYFDSAIIVKLYVQEATSHDAIRLVSLYPTPYCLTVWQSLEVGNAIRLKAYRKEITSVQMAQSTAAFEHDVGSARWRQPAYSSDEIVEKAIDLSMKYSATLGCRSLDIIHVAAALVIGSTDFITFDVRQADLARHAGLRVIS